MLEKSKMELKIFVQARRSNRRKKDEEEQEDVALTKQGPYSSLQSWS